MPLITLLVASTSHAVDPEKACQAGRFRAAAHYATCVDRVFGSGFSPNSDSTPLLRCVTKYAATWKRLHAKAVRSEATCNSARFQLGEQLLLAPGTVIDQLTGLQWEVKENLDNTPNPTDPHDADNEYTWSATGTAADGTAFTSFLSSLNGSCFGGQCDWRIPTAAELLSIVRFPDCTETAPDQIVGRCIDPVFGGTAPTYWSSTVLGVPAPLSDFAAIVDFFQPETDLSFKDFNFPVRAVRGGY